MRPTSPLFSSRVPGQLGLVVLAERVSPGVFEVFGVDLAGDARVASGIGQRTRRPRQRQASRGGAVQKDAGSGSGGRGRPSGSGVGAVGLGLASAAAGAEGVSGGGDPARAVSGDSAPQPPVRRNLPDGRANMAGGVNTQHAPRVRAGAMGVDRQASDRPIGHADRRLDTRGGCRRREAWIPGGGRYTGARRARRRSRVEFKWEWRQ